MTKQIIVRVEFNVANETIHFDTPFRSQRLRSYDLDKRIVDFAIIPIKGTNFFTDEEISTLLAEFDEKVKSYEILEVV